MDISIHDNILLSYCVIADKREIHFHTAFSNDGTSELTDVVFTGVVAYSFTNDRFETVIFDIEEVRPDEIYDEIYVDYRALFEAGRPHCWPGRWNESEDSALDYFINNDVKAYYLAPSIGMSGWVMAKSMKVVATPA